MTYKYLTRPTVRFDAVNLTVVGDI